MSRKQPLLQNPEALRHLREKDGLTQSALARKAQTSSQHVWRMENGDKSASPELLCRLAAALDVPKSAITRSPCEHCEAPRERIPA